MGNHRRLALLLLLSSCAPKELPSGLTKEERAYKLNPTLANERRMLQARIRKFDEKNREKLRKKMGKKKKKPKKK